MNKNKKEDDFEEQLLTIVNLKRELKKHRIGGYIMFIAMLLCFILTIYVMYEAVLFKSTYNIKINFEDEFNITEKEKMNFYLDNIKPEYLKASRSITFVKNPIIIRNKLYAGYNRNKHIQIYYKDCRKTCDYEMMRTICHELLHSLIYVNNNEYFIKDIDDTLICYNDNIRSKYKK